MRQPFILLSLAATLLILAACDVGPHATVTNAPSADSSIVSETVIGAYTGNVYTIKHDGHLFILYGHGGSYSSPGSIIHHPDCPCLKTVRSLGQTP